MENQVLQNMPLPHNFWRGERQIRKVRKLINTARELGGTAYDVAAESGLLSAAHFMELQFDPAATQEPVLAEDMTVVTECFVEFPGDEEPDRIFLYSSEADKDVWLKQLGRIQNRKLLLPYECLSELHEKGYHCYYAREEGGKGGKRSARYQRAFGRDRQAISMDNLWGNATYVGSGENQALIVRTVFAPVIVMPDVYAVEEAVRTYYAENLIREVNEGDFRIERIAPEDEEVLRRLADPETEVLGSSQPELYRMLPDGYRRLSYQIAYLQTYYPEVYEKVWASDFEPDDEKRTLCFGDNAVTLGITFQRNNKAYGVCVWKDGRVKRVPRLDDYEIPLCRKYAFSHGSRMLCNAGVAGSRLALAMKEIKQCAEVMLDVSVEKVCATYELLGEEMPTAERIALRMERWRRRAERNGTENSSFALIAYEQLKELHLDGEGVIHWAAEQAGISSFAYLDSERAILNALRTMRARQTLKEKELFLLYDFRPELLTLSLYRIGEDKQEELLVSLCEYDPERGNWQQEETDWQVDLEEALAQDMREFMLEEGLRSLVTGEGQTDRKAFEELTGRVDAVRSQLRRGDSAKLKFDNGYLNMLSEYPIERLEKLFEPILEKSRKRFMELLDRAELCPEEISAVFLTGEETEYPFVRKHIEELTGRTAYGVNDPECIVARGAALDG